MAQALATLQAAVKNLQRNAEADTCAVCFELLDGNADTLLQVHAQDVGKPHVFHKQCLFAYFADLTSRGIRQPFPCPMCRQPSNIVYKGTDVKFEYVRIPNSRVFAPSDGGSQRIRAHNLPGEAHVYLTGYVRAVYMDDASEIMCGTVPLANAANISKLVQTRSDALFAVYSDESPRFEIDLDDSGRCLTPHGDPLHRRVYAASSWPDSGDYLLFRASNARVFKFNRGRTHIGTVRFGDLIPDFVSHFQLANGGHLLVAVSDGGGTQVAVRIRTGLLRGRRLRRH
jgi:hypothetical protein